MTRLETTTVWLLRATVLATGAFYLTGDDPAFGAFCLLSVAIAIVPSLHARSGRMAWPVEVDLVFAWFLAAHFTFGHLLDLYEDVAWFDKVLHLGDSVLVGFVAFFAVYLAHFMSRSRTHPWIDGFAILLVTLGFGALWEIAEFAADQLLGRHTQGSPTLSPLDDTMWDLILDGAGGIVGAILGSIYMHRSIRSRERVAAFAARIAALRAQPAQLEVWRPVSAAPAAPRFASSRTSRDRRDRSASRHSHPR